MDVDSNYLYLATNNGLFQMKWGTKIITNLSKLTPPDIKELKDCLYRQTNFSKLV